LDEITPLQETMKTLVPQFVAETGIKVDYELLNHFEVINKGQADLLSRRGAYDAVMLHAVQVGQMLAAGAVEPIDGFMADKKLINPGLDLGDLIQPANDSLTKFGGKTYGFLTWNYNMVYWARADLLNDAGEKAAFKARYGYDLSPAKTYKQFLDIGEFFTRKAGEKLAGQVLKSDFYGILHEGIPGGATLVSVWENMIRNFGGDLFDGNGRPSFDSPQVVAALTLWAKMWKYSPPGQAEYSLVDVPTVMGNGIAAQSIAYSDFVLGIDKPGAPLGGKFVYGGIPTNADNKSRRSAASEPSLLVISKASKNKEATYLFVQWMVEKSTQKKLIEAGKGGVPVRTSSFSMPELSQGPLSSLYAAMKNTMEVAVAKPKVPKMFEIYDALNPIVQQVGLGKISPEAAAKAGQEKMLAICTKCTL
jgi:multiple sugar transport system substrate-binding protein